jgi:hypothetical protein
MTGLSEDHLRVEVIAPATGNLPVPDESVVLRYERRATLLKARGEIAREIRYAEHYLPIAASLVGQAV